MIGNQSQIAQLLVNMICIFLLLFSCVKIRENKNYRYPFVNAFIILNVIANVFELLTTLYFRQSAMRSDALLYILQNGYNCSALLACGCWFWNSMAITENRLYRKKAAQILISLPLLVLVLLTITTSYHHWIFYVDALGQYTRGIYFSPFMSIAAVYILAAFGFYLYANWKKDYFVFQKLNREAVGYTLFLLVCVFIQAFTRGSMSVINVAAAIITLMIHEDLQQKAITVDSLTGLNNRNAINTQVLRMLKQKKSGQYAAILDVDLFKKINDKYGHLEGDRALKMVAETFHRIFNDHTFYGRIGGDEFLLLLEDCDGVSAGTLENRINETLKEVLHEHETPYIFTVSVGIGPVSDEMSTIPDLLEVVDKKLYERKKEKTLSFVSENICGGNL